MRVSPVAEMYLNKFGILVQAGSLDLPPEILLKIFGYLNVDEICVAAQVCRLWRDVAYDQSLYQVLEFISRENVDFILTMLRRARNLHSLSLHFQPQTDIILEEVCTSNGALCVLSMQDCRGSLDRDSLCAPTLRKLLDQCPNLETLKIRHCSGVTKAFYKEVGAKLPLLKNVSFDIPKDYGPLLLESISLNCPALEKLRGSCIFDDIQNGWTEEEHLKAICMRLGPNLKTIQLNSSSWNEDSYLELLKCPRLHNLAMRYAFKLTGRKLYRLCSTIGLQKLDVTMSLEVASFEWARCLNCDNMKNLRSLSLVFCQLSNQVMEAIGFNLRSLQKIRIVGALGQVTPEGFGYVIRHCTKLRSIEFIYVCRSAIVALLQLHGYLIHLERLLVLPMTTSLYNRLRGAMPRIELADDVHGNWKRLVFYITMLIQHPDILINQQ